MKSGGREKWSRQSQTMVSAKSTIHEKWSAGKLARPLIVGSIDVE